MQYTHILGIDIAKKTIDVALSQNQANASMITHHFTNNAKGHQALLVWLEKLGVQLEQLLIGLENTGDYHRSLVTFLQSHQAFVWVENAAAIKWSGGLQRGKTDKMDAQRICLYAFRNQDKARAFSAKDEATQQIADLTSQRKCLIQARVGLLVSIKEKREAGLEKEAAMLEETCKGTLASMNKDIKSIEDKIKCIIQEHEQLRINYQIICSVPGVGFVTAILLLIYTNNFKRFDNAKQLASYCGVAPFAYSSGTSVRGRTQVSPIANKTLKTALHMCAVSSIKNNKEMKQYYEKKVNEGKKKMTILNAIRNKLLNKVFACVRDKKMYDYDYTYDYKKVA